MPAELEHTVVLVILLQITVPLATTLRWVLVVLEIPPGLLAAPEVIGLRRTDPRDQGINHDFPVSIFFFKIISTPVKVYLF